MLNIQLLKLIFASWQHAAYTHIHVTRAERARERSERRARSDEMQVKQLGCPLVHPLTHSVALIHLHSPRPSTHMRPHPLSRTGSEENAKTNIHLQRASRSFAKTGLCWGSFLNFFRLCWIILALLEAAWGPFFTDFRYSGTLFKIRAQFGHLRCKKHCKTHIKISFF